MSRLTFVHAADLHLDTPFEGLGRVAPEVAEVLRDSSLAAWEALVTLCVERQARLLLVAGDIYDGEERGLRAQLRFLRGLERLSERGVRVFIVHGNHDPHGGRWSAIREWPTGVTVFGDENVEVFPATDVEGRQVALIHGISHASRSVSDNLATRFRRTPESLPQFGLLHCNADQDPNHPAYAPCTLDDLRSAGMDYWALGHIHNHRVLSRGNPWILYAGGLQGRSLKPGEVGVKGVVIGSIASGRITDVEFVAVPHIHFAELTVDIGDLPDTPRLIDRLEEAAESVLGGSTVAGLVARVTLVGRGPLHADLAGPDRVDDLLKAIREEANGRRPLLWWSGIVAATRPDIDREAIRRRGDFSAELLQLTARLRDDPDALTLFVQEEEAALHSGLLRRFVTRVANDATAVLEDAEMLALERLESGSDE